MNEERKRTDHEEFVSNVVNFLTMNPGSNVILILETRQGPQLYTNASPFWQLGATKWANEFMSDMLKRGEAKFQELPPDVGGKPQ